MHDDLRDALRRVDPPAGFAERVINKTRGVHNVRLKADATNVASPRPSFRWAVAATLVAATIGGGVWYRAEEQRREGEEARRQVLLSLNIAGSKLRSVEMKVNTHEEER
jgi:hypothetical protein